jgi:anti-sigma regulatory factor (Ser/Thr protein kinase)
MNAMEHGGQFDPEQRVEVTRIRTASLVPYIVRDPGLEFDVAALPHAAVSSPSDPIRHVEYRSAQGMRAGGFGLLLARGLVDALIHSSLGNEVVLIKYLGTG